MAKPTEYFVTYADPKKIEQWKRDYPDEADDPDPTFIYVDRDVPNASTGRRLAVQLKGVLYRRTNFVDVTPGGDPPGVLWDWDTREEFAP